MNCILPTIRNTQFKNHWHILNSFQEVNVQARLQFTSNLYVQFNSVEFLARPTLSLVPVGSCFHFTMRKFSFWIFILSSLARDVKYRIWEKNELHHMAKFEWFRLLMKICIAWRNSSCMCLWHECEHRTSCLRTLA